MSEIHDAIDAVWRIESAKLIAALARIVRDVGIAEELAQDALVAALESGRLAGAGLDVLEGEPPAVDDDLRRIESVTLTPHVAFDSVEAVEAVATRAAGHAAAVLAGEVPETIVNPEVLRQANPRLRVGAATASASAVDGGRGPDTPRAPRVTGDTGGRTE